MISLSPSTRYFVYQGYANMVKSFNGLCGIVTNELHQELLSGDVFIFFNKRKTSVKILTWETDGFSIYYKQLQKGTYEFTPNDVDGTGAVMLDGKMEDDASVKQCRVILELARELSARDPELAKTYEI